MQPDDLARSLGRRAVTGSAIDYASDPTLPIEEDLIRWGEEKKRHDEEEKTPKSDGEADTEAGEASVAPECSNATSRQSSFQASRQISVPVSVPAVLSPKNSFLKSSTDGSSGWSLMPEVAEPTAAQQPADQETTAEMLVT